MAKNNPMFERRHYEAMAANLNDAVRSNPEGWSISIGQGRQICEAFADRLERDNPRFDRARFLKACGVEN